MFGRRGPGLADPPGGGWVRPAPYQMGGNKKDKRKADKGRPRDSTGVGRGAVSETTLVARAGVREKVHVAKEAAAEKKRHQMRENDRAKRHKPEEEGVHLSPPAPAAAAAAAPGAVSSALTGVGPPTLTYSPAPHDPSTDAGRQQISRGKRNIEEALEAQGHGKRQQVQHLQAAARVPGSAVAAFAAILAADSAAAHAGERIKQALAEPKLNGEARATMLAALSVGKGKDKPVLNFALGTDGKQLSGGRKAQLRHDRKKRATRAGASWARAVDERKPRSDGYWFGEKGQQIHQIIEDKWVELATASPLKRRANKSEPGSRCSCINGACTCVKKDQMYIFLCPLFKRFGPHYSVACRPARPTSPRPRPPADRSRRASPSWIGSA